MNNLLVKTQTDDRERAACGFCSSLAANYKYCADQFNASLAALNGEWYSPTEYRKLFAASALARLNAEDARSRLEIHLRSHSRAISVAA